MKCLEGATSFSRSEASGKERREKLCCGGAGGVREACALIWAQSYGILMFGFKQSWDDDRRAIIFANQKNIPPFF